MKKRVLAVLCAVLIFAGGVLQSYVAFASVGEAVGIVADIMSLFENKAASGDDINQEIYDYMYQIVAADTWNVQGDTRQITGYKTGVMQEIPNQTPISKYYSLSDGTENTSLLSIPYLQEYNNLFALYWNVPLLNAGIMLVPDSDIFCAYMYNRYKDEHPFSGTIPDGAPEYDDVDLPSVQVSGKTFSEICAQLQEQYAPDVATEYISWRYNGRYWNNEKTKPSINFYYEGEIVGSTKGKYFLPFYRDMDGSFYFPLNQFHIYNDSVFADDGSLSALYIKAEALDNDGNVVVASNGVYNGISDRYWDICLVPQQFIFSIVPYNTYNGYIQHQQSYNGHGFVFSSLVDFANMYKSTDSSQTVRISSTLDTSLGYDFTVLGSEADGVYDYGFFVSDEPIIMDGGIPDEWELNRIPDNYYVTFDGDNIYNYTITDPDTGGTSTVNEYVTNNYTITNNYGSDGDDSGSSGGTTSGDVNVGGSIGVNGNVGVNGQVDVNLNVNVNTGSDGADPDDTPVIDWGTSDAISEITGNDIPGIIDSSSDSINSIFEFYDSSIDNISALFGTFFTILPEPIRNFIPLAVILICIIGLFKALH